jgi:hypothetical protein
MSESDLGKIQREKSVMIVGFYNPSSDSKEVEFEIALVESNWKKIILWVIIIGSIIAALALCAGISMIYKKYRKKDELGFGEDILVGEQEFKGRKGKRTKSFIRIGNKTMNLDE